MATLIHKQTGKQLNVSADGLKKIMDNPMTKDLYKVLPAAEEPEEVTALKQQKAQQNNTPNVTKDQEHEEPDTELEETN